MARFWPGILPPRIGGGGGIVAIPRRFWGIEKVFFHKVIRVFHKTKRVSPLSKIGFRQSASGFPVLKMVLRGLQKGLRIITGYSEKVFPSPEKIGHGKGIKTIGAGPDESIVRTIRHKTKRFSPLSKMGFRQRASGFTALGMVFRQSASGFPVLKMVFRACRKVVAAITGYSETVFQYQEKGGQDGSG
jgi:hypothetical protein